MGTNEEKNDDISTTVFALTVFVYTNSNLSTLN